MKIKHSESMHSKESKRDKELKNVVKKHVSAISDKIIRDTGKKVNFIKNKKEAATSVFNDIKSSDLYKLFNQQESYTSEADFQKSFIGFLAGIGIADFLEELMEKSHLLSMLLIN